MSINSVLNNNISVQTNILNSRGETDRDVALKEYDGGVAADSITINLSAEDSNSDGLISRGFGIKVPAAVTAAGPQTIILQFADNHQATSAENLITTHLGTQAAAGTGVVGYIDANLLGDAGGGALSPRQIRLTRHSPNGQTLAAAYLEARILVRDSTA